MKPERRYFKCSLDKEPIKSLHRQWNNDNEKRDKELQAIFEEIKNYKLFLTRSLFMNIGTVMKKVFWVLYVIQVIQSLKKSKMTSLIKLKV
nr:DUF5420 family protein [Pasteurella multocida]